MDKKEEDVPGTPAWPLTTSPGSTQTSPKEDEAVKPQQDEPVQTEPIQDESLHDTAFHHPKPSNQNEAQDKETHTSTGTETGKVAANQDPITVAAPVRNTIIAVTSEEQSARTKNIFPSPVTPEPYPLRREPRPRHNRFFFPDSSNSTSPSEHNKDQRKSISFARALAQVFPRVNGGQKDIKKEEDKNKDGQNKADNQGGRNLEGKPPGSRNVGGKTVADRQRHRAAMVLAATNLGSVCSLVAAMGVLINSQQAGVVAPAGIIAWLVVSCVALACSSTAQSVLQLYSRRGAGAAHRSEEEWIELAHRQRTLPPIDSDQERLRWALAAANGEPRAVRDIAAQDEAWDKFVGDPARLRRYVEGLEEQLAIGKHLAAAADTGTRPQGTIAADAVAKAKGKGKAREEIYDFHDDEHHQHIHRGDLWPSMEGGHYGPFTRAPTPFAMCSTPEPDIFGPDRPFNPATARLPGSSTGELDPFAAVTEPYSPLSSRCCTAGPVESRAIMEPFAGSGYRCDGQPESSASASSRPLCPPTITVVQNPKSQIYRVPPGRVVTHQRGVPSLDIINGKIEGI